MIIYFDPLFSFMLLASLPLTRVFLFSLSYHLSPSLHLSISPVVQREVVQREETWNTVPMTKNSRTIDPSKIPKISKVDKRRLSFSTPPGTCSVLQHTGCSEGAL